MGSSELLYQWLETLALLGAVIHHGVAPRYSPGLMAQVSRNRDLPIVGCMVSSPRYPIGTWLMVISLNTTHTEWCRVTDVSHPRDRARHLRLQREVELGYPEAQRICGQKALNDRPDRCPIIVVYVPKETVYATNLAAPLHRYSYRYLARSDHHRIVRGDHIVFRRRMGVWLAGAVDRGSQLHGRESYRAICAGIAPSRKVANTDPSPWFRSLMS